MNILRIEANWNDGSHSYSIGAGDEVVKELLAKDKNARVETINVFKENIPSLAKDLLPAWGNGQQNEATKTQAELLAKFKAADVYVVVAPMWNFSFPSELRNFFDNVLIAKETFMYTETGVVGLLEGKKAIIVTAMGGMHVGQSTDFLTTYLKQIFAFVGADVVGTVAIQGTGMNEVSVSDAVKKHMTAINEVVAAV